LKNARFSLPFFFLLLSSFSSFISRIRCRRRRPRSFRPGPADTCPSRRQQVQIGPPPPPPPGGVGVLIRPSNLSSILLRNRRPPPANHPRPQPSAADNFPLGAGSRPCTRRGELRDLLRGPSNLPLRVPGTEGPRQSKSRRELVPAARGKRFPGPRPFHSHPPAVLSFSTLPGPTQQNRSDLGAAAFTTSRAPNTTDRDHLTTTATDIRFGSAPPQHPERSHLSRCTIIRRITCEQKWKQKKPLQRTLINM